MSSNRDENENIHVLDGLVLDEIKMTDKELQKEKIRNMKKEKAKIEKIEEKILTQTVENTVKEVRPEVISERQELILALQDYANDDLVGKFLDSLHFDLSIKKLEKLSLDELRELLTAIQRASNSKSLNLFWGSLVMGGVRVFEILFSLSRWKDKILLGGLHEDLKTDEDWNFSLRCFFLENRKVFYMRPSLRLFFMMIHKILHRHTVNSGARQVQMLLNGLSGQPPAPPAQPPAPPGQPPAVSDRPLAPPAQSAVQLPTQPPAQPPTQPPAPIERKVPFMSPSPILSGVSSLDSSDIESTTGRSQHEHEPIEGPDEEGPLSDIERPNKEVQPPQNL